ncbi:DUF218 domain, partial [Geosmithia morbida]
MPPSRLIVVCCHGIWMGGVHKGRDESEWLIADFQRGETLTFIEHARAGVSSLAQSEDAVLVFSGGPTRQETGLSESESYANLARENDYWGHRNLSPSRILCEDRALDSYQNILFSLTLFHARYAEWPSHLTLVSHAFKRPRLVDGHCVAIGWPLDRLDYVGIDPPGLDGKTDAVVGVAAAVGDWADDPHGRGDKLRGKRTGRNPHGVWQGVYERG